LSDALSAEKGLFEQLIASNGQAILGAAKVPVTQVTPA
jgi:hypothetical protein